MLVDIFAMRMSRAAVSHIGPNLENSVRMGMLSASSVIDRRQEESQSAEYHEQPLQFPRYEAVCQTLHATTLNHAEPKSGIAATVGTVYQDDVIAATAVV